MASYYEMTYGPIADSYANKYGVPADLFRSYINDRSGFDPFFTGVKGSGIAAVTDNTKGGIINVFDPAQQLDLAAQEISKYYSDTKNWATAFKNVGYNIGSDSADNMPAVDAMGNPTGGTIADQDANDAATKSDSPSWFESIKKYFAQYVYSGIIFVAGLLLILATLYVVVQRGTGEK